MAEWQVRIESPFDYLFDKTHFFPVSIYHYLSMVAKMEGMMFTTYACGALPGGYRPPSAKPVGVCFLLPMNGGLDVLCIYVTKEHRRQGVATALLMAMDAYCADAGLTYSLRIIDETTDADVFRRLAGKFDMQTENTLTLYHCMLFEVIPMLNDLQETRFAHINTRLLKKGYTCVSFAEAPSAAQRLRSEIGSSFPGYLNPFRLPNRSDSYSFITLCDDVPMAFSAASRIGEKVIFEQIAARTDGKGRGAFAMVLSRFIDQVINDKVVRVTFAVYDHNKEMRRMGEGVLSPLISSVKHQTTWKKRIQLHNCR